MALTSHITAAAGICVTSSAPVVASAALDAFVTEGETLQTSGTFTDPDPGDALR